MIFGYYVVGLILLVVSNNLCDIYGGSNLKGIIVKFLCWLGIVIGIMLITFFYLTFFKIV